MAEEKKADEEFTAATYAANPHLLDEMESNIESAATATEEMLVDASDVFGQGYFGVDSDTTATDEQYDAIMALVKSYEAENFKPTGWGLRST